MSQNNPSSSRPERKFIEKNRRNEMNSLYSKLHSLLPDHQTQTSRKEGRISLPEQLDAAAKYINSLQSNLENTKQKRDNLRGLEPRRPTVGAAAPPHVEIRQSGSVLEVVLITGSDCNFTFSEVIRMILEEGVEIVNASFWVTENSVFHTIHSKVEETHRDYVATRISERLHRFVDGATSSC